MSTQFPFETIRISQFPVEVRRTISHITNDPSVLRDLASDPDRLVREGIINKPLTPELQVKLAEDPRLHPALVIFRGLTPEALNVILQGDDQQALDFVAGSPETPPEVLNTLQNHPNAMVRQSLARNRFAPPEILTRLLNDSNPDVRRWAAKNSSTPPEALIERLEHDLEDLAEIESNPGRGALEIGLQEAKIMPLVSNPSIPKPYLERLGTSPNASVRWAVGENQSTPPVILEELARIGGYDIPLAKNPSTPPNVLEEIWERSLNYRNIMLRKEILGRIALNPNTPPAVLARLAEDYDDTVSHNARENPSIPAQTLTRLAESQSTESGIIYNPNAPPEALVTLARRGVREVLHNPNAPEEAIRILAAKNSDYINEALAKSSRTPTDIFETLAHSNSGGVRAALVKNSSVPDEILEEMVCDSNPQIAQTALARVMKNPNVLARAWQTCPAVVPEGAQDAASYALIQKSLTTRSLDDLVLSLSRATPRAAAQISVSNPEVIQSVCTHAHESDDAMEACRVLLNARKSLLFEQ